MSREGNEQENDQKWRRPSQFGKAATREKFKSIVCRFKVVAGQRPIGDRLLQDV